MFHRALIASACVASVGGLAAPAEAARFAFDFTAPVQFCYWTDEGTQQCYAGDTATGSGLIDADDNGDGSFSITRASGNVFPWDGSDPWRISAVGAGNFASDGSPTIDFIGGSYQLDNLGLGFDGPYSSGMLLFFRASDDGRLTGYAGDGGLIVDPTFHLAPAAGAVPEVATWGMMLLGFGAIGTALRRRTAVRFA